jgi:beta-xylosidase
MVNWTIIGHALKRQPPFQHFSVPRHREGVWAPALRYHNSEFYLYYPDPDFGILSHQSKKSSGSWSDPDLVESGKV